ncbi:phage major capsid protein [Photobacterium leiognathi]|uniref:phage major capsid protein n=1 Tax=Photobacterium leiognathi TaxID=553611 RepID=UPI000D171DA9|nr:phage major capsid protein [Photobacterium leiognathi]PSW53025.1 phage major capsid protein [Photobacterium leiognathi subsp. mandapamensis]
MTIHEMKMAAAGKIEQMRAIVNAADAENRDLTDEEQSKYDTLKSERAALNKRIERAEELEREESALGTIDDNPHKPTPSGATNDNPINGKEYQDAFAAVVSARRNQVGDDARNALKIGTTDGHFAVPEKYRSEMIKKLGAHNCLREICNVITTTSIENIPVVTDNGSAGWVDELGAYPESDMSGDRKVLGAHKLGRISKISEELLSDEAVSLESTLADAYAKSFGDAEEVGMWTGDGNKKPLGLETQVTKKHDAAAADAITADDLIDLQHAIKRAYRANAVYVMHDKTIAMVRKLKNANGDYIWKDSMKEGEPDRLLGKPVYSTDAIPVPAAGKASVYFGDFKQGVDIGDRGTIYMQRLEELYAANGAIGFRMRSRVDCVLKDVDAVAKLLHPSA